MTDILYLFGTKFIFRVYEGKVGNFLKCTFGYYMHELEHPMQTPFGLLHNLSSLQQRMPMYEDMLILAILKFWIFFDLIFRAEF